MEDRDYSTNGKPRVSCLMVTANRMQLAARAVKCFEQQSYPNKELVVIDDGRQDYLPLFERIDPADIIYIRIPKTSDLVLGTLRNIALQYASGDYVVQWDDDDWYHPDRIAKQAAYLDMGYDACCLSASLMHLDNPVYFFHPYIGYLPDGIPGSIMHRRSGSIRYPEYRRAEDTAYLKQWMKRRYIKLPSYFAGLFIRCFHGTNTWEEDHFTRRIRNSPSSWMHYLYYRYVRGEVTGHPRFHLSSHMQTAFEQYVRDSQNLDLFSTTSLHET